MVPSQNKLRSCLIGLSNHEALRLVGRLVADRYTLVRPGNEPRGGKRLPACHSERIEEFIFGVNSRKERFPTRRSGYGMTIFEFFRKLRSLFQRNAAEEALSGRQCGG